MSKVKLHFATRVSTKLTPKHDTEGSASQQRVAVLAEINKHKVNIDRSVFSKSDKEKEELRIEKAHYRKLQRI
jgi:hypothetical protein